MFDPLTLLAVLALTHLLSTSSLAVVWYVNRTIPGIKEWTIGRLLVTLAIVAFALRASVSLPLSVVIGNTLMAVGFYVMLMGHPPLYGAQALQNSSLCCTATDLRRLHGLLLNRRNQLDCPHHRHITNHLALQPVGRLVALAESSRRRDHLLPTDGLHLYLPRPV
ncbi:hypothetical protein [Solemya pervernicosa gill symbiont]|uniref:hypothetical protein n=1 Tax=Solemya pervernicosa gill symbiont TaxID=642797 RepID=UPI0015608AB4|nr:hypothetical protein [Solemya pervernicosa gill symbiont]